MAFAGIYDDFDFVDSVFFAVIPALSRNPGFEWVERTALVDWFCWFVPCPFSVIPAKAGIQRLYY